MPMQMLRLRPGVNVESTPSQNEAGYQSSNLIRFRNALAEKIGGWITYIAFSLGGIPKAMHAWLDLNEQEYLAVGTTTILGAITDGSLTSLTPQQKTTNFAPNFTTTMGSPNVTIIDANVAGITVLDSVQFLTPISVDGIILSGAYPISAVLGSTTYRIVAATNGEAGVNNGGAVPVFTTTAGSTVVSVLFEDHGLTETGDTINFPISTVISTTGNDTYTKSLLPLNGADASTTITDVNAGGSAHVWTAHGNAQIDTAQFELGGASLLCDGTGDYVDTPDSSDFTLGSGDFTADFWFRPATTGTTINLAGQVNAAGISNADSAWAVVRDSSNVIKFSVVTAGPTVTTVTGTTSISASTWYHVAAVRSGNFLLLFINGVLQGSPVAVSGSINNSASALGVGSLGGLTATPWNGWIDEFRLSVGVARWTTAFTVPTAEYATQAVEIVGTYSAVAITNADNFTISIAQVAGDAGSFAMNGGLCRMLYYITLGPVASVSGYGIDTYGSGTYGIGNPGGAPLSGTPITATDWSLDNWGQTLLACPDGDGIYQWTPNTGLQNAQLVATGPPKNTGLFVATEIQIAIAFGSTETENIGIDQDPLLVKWSAQGDYTDWTISLTNQAGARRLSTGSKIVGGVAAPQFNILWTDIGVWAMNYIGFPDVFGFNPLGYGCGLIGKHAHTRLGSNIYWMSQTDFFVLGGGAPQPLTCTVWDSVFQDLNETYQHKSWAWSNSPFNEVWFFYPRASTNATEPDAYAKFNARENTWDTGVLDRTCGINQSILGMPIAASSAGLVYQHETGYNDANHPITATFQTGDWQLSEGNDVLFVDWILPDMKFITASGATTSASVQITFYSSYYPGGPVETHGPYTFTSSTTYINTRIRGRLINMKIESSDLSSWWRIGGIRFRGAPDGRL